jgi:hypothetical protein
MLLRIIKPSGCWVTGTKLKDPNEYDRIEYMGVTDKVHKISYVYYFGAIPDGLEIDHLCRNRQCFNPAHLEAVTHKENVLRGNGHAARHAKQTHCIHGHPLEGDNVRWFKTVSGVGRQCRACHKITASKWYLKHKGEENAPSENKN